MRPGELKRRVNILRPTTTTDEYGGAVVTYTDLGNVWCKILTLGGSRRLQYEQSGWTKPKIITMRQDIDLLEDDIINISGIYNVINSIERDEDRYKYQVVTVSETYNG